MVIVRRSTFAISSMHGRTKRIPKKEYQKMWTCIENRHASVALDVMFATKLTQQNVSFKLNHTYN